MSLKYLIIGFFLLLGCKSTDLKMASKFKLIDESINLKVFIGEKILVNEFDPNKNNEKKVIDSITGDTIIRKTYVMDRGFLAKYKVVQNVFNDLKTDTIEFLVYDHYGRPEFENYENVLLYISLNKEKNNYYHQKHQFNPVERTKKKTWKGLKGESIENLFTEKKNGVLKARGTFGK